MRPISQLSTNTALVSGTGIAGCGHVIDFWGVGYEIASAWV
ncbi:MAG: hypothetical protein ABI356_02640 [Steroidobacteraceae bacterium]